ncbi:HNH endonuclease family protein [Ligilactobacillus ruminis]|uniref:HNH endonuclease family protein n=1 Tax=Ligilactobacillus ruminis TaxID=1623 RepID=UPI003F9C7525
MMDSKVVFPYFMLLLDLANNGEIEQSYANELAHILEDYIFRIKVCQMPTNRMNKVVIALCDTEKDNGNLKIRLLKMLKTSFPDDKKFTESLMTVDLYHQRNHLAKLALEILEENRTKETIDFEDAQVEHVMPQSLNSEWRLQIANADKVKEQYGGTIGNLTLTKYNQEMSNKLYEEKCDFYKDSNISLTRDIANEYDHCDKEAILDRS